MAETKEPNRLAIYYRAFRCESIRALDAYEKAQKMIEETEVMIEQGSVIAGTMINSLLPIAVAVSVAAMALHSFLGYVKDGLWITSPSGKTTIELPLQLALRVIRKRKWKFANVAPVEPNRTVNRREALKILLTGDK